MNIKVKEANAIALDNPKMTGLNTAYKEALKKQTPVVESQPEISQQTTPAQMINNELSMSESAKPIAPQPQLQGQSKEQQSDLTQKEQSPLLLEIFNDFTIAQKHLDQLGEKVLRLYNEKPDLDREVTPIKESIEPSKEEVLVAPLPQPQPQLQPQSEPQPQPSPMSDFKIEEPKIASQMPNVFDNPTPHNLKTP